MHAWNTGRAPSLKVLLDSDLPTSNARELCLNPALDSLDQKVSATMEVQETTKQPRIGVTSLSLLIWGLIFLVFLVTLPFCFLGRSLLSHTSPKYQAPYGKPQKSVPGELHPAVRLPSWLGWLRLLLLWADMLAASLLPCLAYLLSRQKILAGSGVRSTWSQ